jgi:dTDP-4-dehydrorhamnose reductase
MAGHMITSYFESLNKYEIIDCDLVKFREKSHEIDILDNTRTEEFIKFHNPNVIINCIGILIKGSEKKPDKAIYINSYFPHQLARIAKEIDAKLIHMSTDCVFSGKTGNYGENDYKDGIGVYAQSKSLGEIVNEKDLTFRMSIIGPEIRSDGTGLFDWFFNQKGSVFGFKNVYWTGITTLCLAKAMDKAIEQNLTGLYHLIPKSKISKFDMLQLFKKIWGRNIDILPNYEQNQDKSLINNRKDFQFEIPDYEIMFQELHDWLQNQKSEVYRKYNNN